MSNAGRQSTDGRRHAGNGRIAICWSISGKFQLHLLQCLVVCFPSNAKCAPDFTESAASIFFVLIETLKAINAKPAGSTFEILSYLRLLPGVIRIVASHCDEREFRSVAGSKMQAELVRLVVDVALCDGLNCVRLQSLIAHTRHVQYFALPHSNQTAYYQTWTSIASAIDWLYTRTIELDLDKAVWPKEARRAVKGAVFGA